MNNRYKDKLKKLDPIKGTDNWNINSLPIHHKSRRSKNTLSFIKRKDILFTEDRFFIRYLNIRSYEIIDTKIN